MVVRKGVPVFSSNFFSLWSADHGRQIPDRGWLRPRFRVYYLDGNGTILWSGITGSPLYDLAMAANERASSYTSTGIQRVNL